MSGKRKIEIALEETVKYYRTAIVEIEGMSESVYIEVKE